MNEFPITINCQLHGEPGLPKPAVLVISEPIWLSLRQHLLQPDRLERAAFLLLGRHEAGPAITYYAHRFMPVADSRCVQQSPVVVEPDPLLVLDSFRAYAKSAAGAYVHAHSHPFCASADFSGTDDQFLPGEVRGLAGYLSMTKSDRPRRFMRFVLGQDEAGFTAQVFDEAGRLIEQIVELRVVGHKGWRRISRFADGNAATPAEPANALDQARLDRNLRFLGQDGQRRICEAKIAICGLGGAGTEFMKNCRGLGFKHYVLVDMDSVDASNLNRLIWSAADIGRPKVDVARDFILAVDPAAQVKAVVATVQHPDARQALLEADIIVNALDNDAARLEVQVLAARHLKPLVDLGSGITLVPNTRQVASMGGQVSVYLPGSACLLCQGLDTASIMSPELRELRRHLGYVANTEETPPSVVTINSVIAGIAGDIVMKYITGFSAVPTWVRHDLLTHKTTVLRFVRRATCPVCGTEGIEGLGDGEQQPVPPPRAMGEKEFFASPRTFLADRPPEIPGNDALQTK